MSAGAPPRLGVVWCPEWPVVAAGCPPDVPMAVLHANRVVARSVAAAEAGVSVGQRRREAQSRCPSLEVVASEPARDGRAFQGVIDAVAALVPRLELTEPGMLTFASRGPSRYFGGDDALAARLRVVVDDALGPVGRAGGAVGVGIADGRFTAAVAAQLASRRAGGHLVVPAGGSASFLAGRSLQWLVDAGGVDPDLAGLLRRLGLADLGALAALPAADVLARFGEPGVHAHRMASGGDDRPPGTHDPPPGMALAHHFDAPVHQLDSLVFVGKQLADRLAGELGAQGRVCTQLLVAAETEHGERSERCWSRATGLSAAAMVERIRWQLDGWGQGIDDGGELVDAHTVTAGVVQLRIEPLGVRADDGVQLGLWGGRTQADEWAQRAAARLVGLVGDQQVVVPAWQGDGTPRRRTGGSPRRSCDLEDPAARLAPADVPPWPGALPTPSPAAVYPTPVEAGVVDADGRAIGVTGPRCGDGALRRGCTGASRSRR